MNIGKTIKMLREKKGIKQKDFAEQISLSATSLSQIENNATRPTRDTLQRICDLLDVPEQLVYILSFDENDVKEGKQDMFKRMYPAVKDLMLNVFTED